MNSSIIIITTTKYSICCTGNFVFSSSSHFCFFMCFRIIFCNKSSVHAYEPHVHHTDVSRQWLLTKCMLSMCTHDLWLLSFLDLSVMSVIYCILRDHIAWCCYRCSSCVSNMSFLLFTLLLLKSLDLPFILF